MRSKRMDRWFIGQVGVIRGSGFRELHNEWRHVLFMGTCAPASSCCTEPLTCCPLITWKCDWVISCLAVGVTGALIPCDQPLSPLITPMSNKAKKFYGELPNWD